MKNNRSIYYSAGVFIGLAIGLLSGIFLDNIGLGITAGLPLGVGLGFLFSRKRQP